MVLIYADRKKCARRSKLAKGSVDWDVIIFGVRVPEGVPRFREVFYSNQLFYLLTKALFQQFVL